MDPSTVKVIAALVVSAIIACLNRTKINVPADLATFLNPIVAQIITALVQVALLMYAAIHHIKGTATAADTGVDGLGNLGTAATPSALLGAAGSKQTSSTSSSTSTSSAVKSLLLFVAFGLAMMTAGCGATTPADQSIEKGMSVLATPLFNEYDTMIRAKIAPAAMDEATAHAAGLLTLAEVQLREASIAKFNALVIQGQNGGVATTAPSAGQ